MRKTIIVSDIKWETDGFDVALPETIEINLSEGIVSSFEDEHEEDEYISDFITELTGYCHKGYTTEVLKDSQ